MPGFKIRVNKLMGPLPIIIVLERGSYIEARDLTVDGATHFVYDPVASSVHALASGQLVDLGEDSYLITRSNA